MIAESKGWDQLDFKMVLKYDFFQLVHPLHHVQVDSNLLLNCSLMQKNGKMGSIKEKKMREK